MPPDNRDFVSWFLLDERQGYCTSFATAMAVMARMVGLPSRYVEGYAATPDADGVARVTQQNAHAWAEIYFTGFGWLPFDPTPGIGNSEDGDSSSDDPQSNPTYAFSLPFADPDAQSDGGTERLHAVPVSVSHPVSGCRGCG